MAEEMEHEGTLGYDPEEHRYLHICGTCYELYEQGRPDGLEQHCRCRPDSSERWPRHDFNQRALLCRCCGLAILSSGSRWDPFFCRECQLMATGVSLWERRLVFPIGRHSMMHTWVPQTPEPSLAAHGGDTNALAESVHESLQSVWKGTDGLWAWYPKAMRQNFKQLGLAGEVRLEAYARAAEQKQMGALATRRERFEGMCQLFRGS